MAPHPHQKLSLTSQSSNMPSTRLPVPWCCLTQAQGDKQQFSLVGGCGLWKEGGGLSAGPGVNSWLAWAKGVGEGETDPTGSFCLNIWVSPGSPSTNLPCCNEGKHERTSTHPTLGLQCGERTPTLP